MKVLKTQFKSWEEGKDGQHADEVFDEANAPTAPLPPEVRTATTSNWPDVETGSRPYVASLSSPGAGSSSRSSRDSLFKPKRQAGTLQG